MTLALATTHVNRQNYEQSNWSYCSVFMQPPTTHPTLFQAELRKKQMKSAMGPLVIRCC